jgi:trans-2,3-dihydro-3-hydroxyanthranilate isomerase
MPSGGSFYGGIRPPLVACEVAKRLHSGLGGVVWGCPWIVAEAAPRIEELFERATSNPTGVIEAAYLLYDVFTDRMFEGNQLAIFPEAAVDDAAMQRIARELNLAETVFVSRGPEGVAATVRIFTPLQEMAFAGHPTIGTAIAMIEKLRWVEPGTRAFVLREGIGDVSITIDAGSPPVAWLTTPPVRFDATIDRDLAAKMLGLEAGAVRADVPSQIVGAGSPFLYIALRDRDCVDRAVLDEALLRNTTGLEGAIVGVYLFAQTVEGAYARMFAPMSGIAEDPATGSATGPLYAFLARYGALAHRSDFVNEQGVAMGRRSVLRVRLGWDGESLERVEVGGHAVLAGEGRLYLS